MKVRTVGDLKTHFSEALAAVQNSHSLWQEERDWRLFGTEVTKKDKKM